ncbi:uncharacterized protein LOC128882857 isoform X2 [Hylaeus volcanicus]|uniref:uncharacterized protein LOC128882857 isoform X2 n=1 Tax=Hylaeus volcanicus TaxID=313075 RepID=UPI0023B84311|nr:uncharacterized protein LOC128882857 isoform X2 [Hylaeus volcanicus]
MEGSSDSNTVYNEFYDEDSASGESNYNFLTTNTKRREANKKKSGQYETPQTTTSDQLHSLLAPFQSCCTNSYFGKETKENQASENPNNVLMTSILEHDDLYEEPSSETSTNSDDTNIGNIPEIVDTTQLKQRYQQTKLSKDLEDTVAEDIISELKSKGVTYSYLINSKALDSTSQWMVSTTLDFTLKTYWLTIDDNIKATLGLMWCSHMELNQPLTSTTLENLMTLSNIPKSISIPEALKTYDEFANMELLHVVEARLVEEILGEFQAAVTSAANTSSTYFIISNIRTVILRCTRYGDVLLINVFDTGVAKNRGPAFLSFNNEDTTERFLINLFTMDHDVKTSKRKFKAWTLFTRPIQYINEDSAPVEAAQDDLPNNTSLVNTVSNAVLDDPQYNAKLMYEKIYNAADSEATDDENNVFTRSLAGGVEILKKKQK